MSGNSNLPMTGTQEVIQSDIDAQTLRKYVKGEEFYNLKKFVESKVDQLEGNVGFLESYAQRGVEALSIDGITVKEIQNDIREKCKEIDLLKNEQRLEIKRLQRQNMETIKDNEKFKELFEQLKSKI